MTANELLADLARRGVTLRSVGDRIRYRPVEAVPDGLLAELRRLKGEVLRLLAPPVEHALGGIEPESEMVTAAEAAAMPLAQFAAAGLLLAVRSKVLGEVVVFASDDAVLDPGERRVVYRARELALLAGMPALDPKGLRAIHELKRTFKGEVTA